LIFDLDETLVHCIDDITNTKYDHKISVTFPTGETIEAGINIRPYAYECLKQAAKNY
jgi:CTD small phosphatase-like protein 2